MTFESKHSPGEWRGNSEHGFVVTDPCGNPKCGCCSKTGTPYSETSPSFYGGHVICETVSSINMPLIVNAPKLYKLAHRALSLLIACDRKARGVRDELKEVLKTIDKG